MKRNITQFIALVLILTWVIGMLVFTASRFIHLLLVGAIMLWLWKRPGKRHRVTSGNIEGHKK